MSPAQALKKYELTEAVKKRAAFLLLLHGDDVNKLKTLIDAWVVSGALIEYYVITDVRNSFREVLYAHHENLFLVNGDVAVINRVSSDNYTVAYLLVQPRRTLEWLYQYVFKSVLTRLRH